MSILATSLTLSCTPGEEHPVPAAQLEECQYSSDATTFNLWAPNAQNVELKLYENGLGGSPIDTIEMRPSNDGIWATKIE